MNQTIQLGNHQFTLQADSLNETNEGLILHGTQPNVNLPIPPRSYYRHGWQSWSLTTWQNPNFKIPIQKPDILHPMQTDPVYAKHPAPNGSWVGAVEFDDGTVLLLGALGTDSHVALHDQQLHGWYEAEAGDWFVGYGKEEDVFAQYASLLVKHLGKSKEKPRPRVWCSWYSLYTAIDEILLHRIFDELDDLPFDVFQVDDGWQVSIGDWGANEKFPSGMKALADKIHASGRTPGLWLAPLIAVQSSALFRQYPEWFLTDFEGEFISAGFNWGEQLYALDTTHPEALIWLADLMKQVRAWGFDYLKLDFLYAGALPGKRHVDMPREAAYRQGLQVMREAMGDDAYFLTCGAPIVPSLGLCDAMRIGPDVADIWESHRDATLLYNPTTPGTKNAIRTATSRYWLNSLVAIDPDVTYFRSTNNKIALNQNRLLQDLALVCNFKATSDLPQWLHQSEREELHLFLESKPNIERIDRYTFKLDDRIVDFSSAIPLPIPPRGINILGRALTNWFGNQLWAMKLLDKLGKSALTKMKKSL